VCLPVLQVGQRIEALDEVDRWREAEVLDFSDDGTQVKVHFRGFRAQFDMWLPRVGSRIRPFGRHKALNKKRRHQTSVNPNADRTRQIAVSSDRYEQYKGTLDRQGLYICPMEGDGNCMFRSVSHQIYGTDRYHGIVREKCMDYMDVERKYFEPYVEGDMDDFVRYLDTKRRDGVWGDDPEVQALCEIYDRPAEIWAYDAQLGAKKLRTFHEASGFGTTATGTGTGAGTGPPTRPPMMLSYYGGGHYDSICRRGHEIGVSRVTAGHPCPRLGGADPDLGLWVGRA
jgi:OTU domain-containing protein 5